MTTLPPRPLRRRGPLSILGVSTVAAALAAVAVALRALGVI